MVGPGVAYPTCTIVATVNGVTYAGTWTAECAAIGGPITTAVTAQAQTYAHDGNDPTKPWYLTYFGYSHVGSGAKGGGAPAGAQPTQDAALSTLAQPSSQGTAVAFGTLANTYTSRLTVLHVGQTVQAQCVVAAEGVFTNEVPTAQFSFNDGTISGTASDDSATTQVAVKDPKTQAVTWVPLVVAISSHQPTISLQDDPSNPYPYVYSKAPPGYQNYAQAKVE